MDFTLCQLYYLLYGMESRVEFYKAVEYVLRQLQADSFELGVMHGGVINSSSAL